jgi:hypothetical protein
MLHIDQIKKINSFEFTGSLDGRGMAGLIVVWVLISVWKLVAAVGGNMLPLSLRVKELIKVFPLK